jgi:hypothetical protein
VLGGRTVATSPPDEGLTVRVPLPVTFGAGGSGSHSPADVMMGA